MGNGNQLIDFSNITDIKDLKALLADEFLHQINLNTAMVQSGQRSDAILARIRALEGQHEEKA